MSSLKNNKYKAFFPIYGSIVNPSNFISDFTFCSGGKALFFSEKKRNNKKQINTACCNSASNNLTYFESSFSDRVLFFKKKRQEIKKQVVCAPLKMNYKRYFLFLHSYTDSLRSNLTPFLLAKKDNRPFFNKGSQTPINFFKSTFKTKQINPSIKTNANLNKVNSGFLNQRFVLKLVKPPQKKRSKSLFNLKKINPNAFFRWNCSSSYSYYSEEKKYNLAPLKLSLRGAICPPLRFGSNRFCPEGRTGQPTVQYNIIYILKKGRDLSNKNLLISKYNLFYDSHKKSTKNILDVFKGRDSFQYLNPILIKLINSTKSFFKKSFNYKSKITLRALQLLLQKHTKNNNPYVVNSQLYFSNKYLITNLIKKSRNIPYSILLIYINMHYRFWTFLSFYITSKILLAFISLTINTTYQNPLKNVLFSTLLFLSLQKKILLKPSKKIQDVFKEKMVFKDGLKPVLEVTLSTSRENNGSLFLYGKAEIDFLGIDYLPFPAHPPFAFHPEQGNGRKGPPSDLFPPFRVGKGEAEGMELNKPLWDLKLGVFEFDYLTQNKEQIIEKNTHIICSLKQIETLTKKTSSFSPLQSKLKTELPSIYIHSSEKKDGDILNQLNKVLWQLNKKRHNKNSLRWIFKKYWLTIDSYTQHELFFWKIKPLFLPLPSQREEGGKGQRRKKGPLKKRALKHKNIVFFKNALKTIPPALWEGTYKLFLTELYSLIKLKNQKKPLMHFSLNNKKKKQKPSLKKLKITLIAKVLKKNALIAKADTKNSLDPFFFNTNTTNTKWIRFSYSSNKRFINLFNFFKLFQVRKKIKYKKHKVLLFTYYIDPSYRISM